MSENDLICENYFSLNKKVTNRIHIVDAVIELYSRYGYLKHPNNEKIITEYEISSRLRNILKRYGILYLSQLSDYTRNEISHFRNLGIAMLNELDKICLANNLAYYEMPELPMAWKRKAYYSILEKIFSRTHIDSLDYFKDMKVVDVYILCEKDLMTTARLYDLLKQSGIILLSDSQTPFIFEYLDLRHTNKLCLERIVYMSDLVKLREQNEAFTRIMYQRNIETSTIDRAINNYLKYKEIKICEQ